MQVTKSRECLNLVEDEQDLIKNCNQICKQLKGELEIRPVKSAKNIINIINGASKAKL